MDEPFKEPVLFHGEVDENSFNLNEPPATGEEYIKRVMYVFLLIYFAIFFEFWAFSNFRLEARNCDDVVYAKIDETRLKKPILSVKPVSKKSIWIKNNLFSMFKITRKIKRVIVQ